MCSDRLGQNVPVQNRDFGSLDLKSSTALHDIHPKHLVPITQLGSSQRKDAHCSNPGSLIIQHEYMHVKSSLQWSCWFLLFFVPPSTSAISCSRDEVMISSLPKKLESPDIEA